MAPWVLPLPRALSELFAQRGYLIPVWGDARVVVRGLVREWDGLSPLCSGCAVEGRAKVLSLGDELRAQGSSLCRLPPKPLGSHPPDL